MPESISPEQRQELRRLAEVYSPDRLVSTAEDMDEIVTARERLAEAVPHLLDDLDARDAVIAEAVTWMRDIARELNDEGRRFPGQRQHKADWLIRMAELLSERADRLAGSVVRADATAGEATE